ncbi:MAG TPA: LUD domain-containing protein [Terracidiphilus sp.]|nr:LUD domain-containing protein [Terracidiphilus sp.]
MTPAASSRDIILGRIRNAAAADSAPAPDHSAAYIRRGQLHRPACLDLMIERLREYNADVVECGPAEIVSSIEEVLRLSGRHTIVAPPGLPGAWRVPGFTWRIDDSLTYSDIETSDAVVTASFAGVADSGTIVLHHSSAEGRRVLTLLPDWHLCILRASQVVETLPEYFDRCLQPPALATYISGPSATADIEMTRIKGVHGPRFLHVLLVHDEDSSQPQDYRKGDHP